MTKLVFAKQRFETNKPDRNSFARIDIITSMSDNIRHTGDNPMHGLTLRKKVINEEIDYLLLKDILADYADPRDKITHLLQTNTLIRVKKGLYVFNKAFAEKPFVKET